MSIAILGDGLLGKELQKITGWETVSRKKHNFDITDKSSFNLLLETIYDNHYGVLGYYNKYTTVVNCIAHTDTYSADRDKHWKTNFEGVSNLVEFCNENNLKLVHISTDFVYTHSKEYVGEDEIPIHGNNWYSYTKLLADAYIELRSKNYLICRGTHKPFPFPYENAWIDQIGNFDYVDKIANLIKILIEKDASGIFNIGTEEKTIYELALKSNADVKKAYKPSWVPENTLMNLTKLKNVIETINN